MTDTIVYGPAYSTYVRTVRLALEEKGVPYRLEEIDFIGKPGAAVTPEHLARHPFAKVPAFEHDGFALYETCAITRYIDETFGGVSLQPDNARGRARMTQAISIVDAYAYPVLIHQIFIPRVVVPMQGGMPDDAAIGDAVPRALNCIDALAAVLGDKPYLAGDEPSLADLHLIPVFDYFRQTPEAERILGSAPGLGQWWASVAARPSVVKTAPSLG